ncbi:MAG: LacI family DNA-binding transcriptional regulator [Streptosporangiaceae bacterium]|nr:LacI family DNA-binding transcriptional regulator [Streptosporangiaceae bacterium]
MTTIQEVARHAKVSTATVSRVLNNHGSVHPDLVRRVRAAVDALAYQRNAVARNLRRSQTSLWAVIVSDVGNPFFTAMVRGLEDVAQQRGCSVVLCNSDEDPEKEADYIAAAAAERMAGVAISAASTATDVTPLVDLGIPVVAIDRRLRGANVDTVLADNQRGAEAATGHLVDMGYRRIACITGPPQAMTASERLKGYKRALRRHGREVPPDLIRHADFRERGGYDAMRSLLADSAPDAVFVTNNLMTVGALKYLVSHGIRVPRDIGVVGFDEIPWADLIRPSLSTVAQPTYDMGRIAGQLLAAHSSSPDKQPETVVLRTSLNIRASSTPAPSEPRRARQA